MESTNHKLQYGRGNDPRSMIKMPVTVHSQRPLLHTFPIFPHLTLTHIAVDGTHKIRANVYTS